MGGLLAVPLILVLAVCVMALVVWASRRQGSDSKCIEFGIFG
jgi:hypothetical protein